VGKLTLEEVINRFGTATERRQELCERFQERLGVVQSTGELRRVWLFGSFATDKPEPDDLDILALFASGFAPATLPENVRPWFDHELCRELHEIDLFYLTEQASDETLNLILGAFGRDRSGRDSILEVMF